MLKNREPVSRKKVKTKSGKKPDGGRPVHLTYGYDKEYNEYPRWIDEYYIKNKEHLKEIVHRVSVIKSHFISAMLAPTGHKLTGNDIVTYINILIQQPIFALVYKKVDGKFIYQPHFDLEKTKSSRGNLELRIRNNKNKWENSFNANEPPKDSHASLFNIMDTDFYFRVFLLDTTKDDQPFYEVTKHKKIDQSLHIELAYEYTRLCLNGLLEFHEHDEPYYSRPFIEKIAQEISNILKNYVYDGNTKDRRNHTIVNKNEIYSVEELIKSRQNETLGKNKQIDKIYEETSNAAEILKLLGDSTNVYHDIKSFPNIFFTLRTYSRCTPRAQRTLDNGNTFNGYAHNVYFSTPYSQQKHIEEYFNWLRKIGRKGYISHIGAKNEIYGGRTNDSDFKWSFGDDDIFSGYQNFANSLDDIFWKFLACNKINALIKIFNMPIGDDSTSMVDAVFYYGASLYRMPFRRLGGLGRLHALQKLYSSLDKTKKANFKYLDIPPDESWRPLKYDCLRVVIFFYLTRMLGPPLLGQEKHYTKIHLYPIEVGGAIVGTIGKVSYDEKLKLQSPVNSLPTNNQTWNQEIIFFTEIVSKIRMTLREQYKDFQISTISDVFDISLSTLIRSSQKTGRVTNEIAKQFVDDLNHESRKVARICPYHEHRFSITNRLQTDGNVDGIIPIGAQLKLIIEKSKTAPIFRSLQSHNDDHIYRENMKSLITKLHEKAQIVLDRYKTLSRYNPNSGERMQ